MRYIVLDTQNQANTVNAEIWARLKEVLLVRGWTLGAADTLVNPKVGRTQRWSVPRQRKDGKWAVPHPECYASALWDINGTAFKDKMMSNLGSRFIETDPGNGTWFT
jgi:hypothetical protein